MFGINNFMCFNRTNFSLEGNYYSDVFTFIGMKLLRCKTNCKNSSEIDAFFSPLQFNVGFINSYFDFNDYESPVK